MKRKTIMRRWAPVLIAAVTCLPAALGDDAEPTRVSVPVIKAGVAGPVTLDSVDQRMGVAAYAVTVRPDATEVALFDIAGDRVGQMLVREREPGVRQSILSVGRDEVTLTLDDRDLSYTVDDGRDAATVRYENGTWISDDFSRWLIERHRPALELVQVLTDAMLGLESGSSESAGTCAAKSDSAWGCTPYYLRLKTGQGVSESSACANAVQNLNDSCRNGYCQNGCCKVCSWCTCSCDWFWNGPCVCTAKGWTCGGVGSPANDAVCGAPYGSSVDPSSDPSGDSLIAPPPGGGNPFRTVFLLGLLSIAALVALSRLGGGARRRTSTPASRTAPAPA